MARITMLSAEDLDPERRRPGRADEKSSVELGTTRILGHQPEMARGLHAFSSSLKANRTLPERLIELVRLRVAFTTSVAAAWRSATRTRSPMT